MWRAGYHGIPITTDFEEYVDGYIDRKIWEHDIAIKVSKENPRYPATTVFFPSSHPDKYFPQAGKMTYIHRKENSSAMRTWGSPLTQEQRHNLLYKGVEPKDIEIVYIDDDYNILSKPPKPYNHEEWLRANTYDSTPYGLRAPDGMPVPPERYTEIRGEPMSAEMLQRYYEYTEMEPPVDTDAIRTAASE